MSTGPIAIIGIGCRYPGGVRGSASYWDFLLNRGCGIVEVPGDRWDHSLFFDPEPDVPGKSRSKWGGFLQGDIAGFDPAFFDLSPREVLSMDPQQRLLLQVAYEAIEDAGATVAALQKQRAGVFVGISTMDFASNQRLRRSGQDIFAGTGSALSIAANRLSHRFDFKGPSIALDTACSSALVAVDQAVRHLGQGTCDVALAGGVNCLLEPGPFISFSSANMLSPSGTIYTFDDRANGYVRAEGCGLLLLKPLDRAVADGDRIYAVIRGTAINQDGKTSTLTSPSGAAQAAMLTTLVKNTGIDPDDVGFVEAHGTGTPIGDPIEAGAIGSVFGGPHRARPVLVGSAKPNLGHLEAAAGSAGLIKAVLSVHHGIVPPNRNFERANRNIPMAALGIEVPVEARPFDGTALAAVNSFGFGGTNASALVEAWSGAPAQRTATRRPLPVAKPQPIAGPAPLFVPISSGSSAGLRLWAGTLAEALDTDGSLSEVASAEVAAQLKQRREHLPERAVVLAADRAGLVAALRDFSEPDEEPEDNAAKPVPGEDDGTTIITGRAAPRRTLALSFSGQGGQWWGMARRLLLEEPVYRQTVDEFDKGFRALSGWSIVEEMLRSEEQTRINDSDATVASIFANQIGLYALWQARGVVPDFLIGHSVGEVAVAYVAGVIDLETATRMVYLRGLVPTHSARRGAMATVGLTVDQLIPLLPADGSLEIAAFNGPTGQTVSGLEESIATLMETVAERFPGVLNRRQRMSFGWHGPQLDEVEEWFRRSLGKVACQPPRVPIISTVTGKLEVRFGEDYWWSNLRQPVNFKGAIDLGLDLGIDAFLELGPHRTLVPLITGIAQERGASAVVVPSLERGVDDYRTIGRAMAGLYVNGVAVDWTASAHDQPQSTVALPLAPWANEHFLQLPLEAKQMLFGRVSSPLLGRREIAPEPTWSSEISRKGFKYLVDHSLSGDCLFPAAGYIEMMTAALRDAFDDGPVELRNVRILEALSIGEEESIQMRTTFDPVTHRLRIYSLSRNEGEDWRLRAQAYGWRHAFALQDTPIDLGFMNDPPSLGHSEFYRLTALHGFEYGPTFQAVQAIWLADKDTSFARLHSREAEQHPGFVVFPGLLDAVLQSGVALEDFRAGRWIPGEALPDDERQNRVFPLSLPVEIRKVLVAGPLDGDAVTRFRVSRQEDSGSYDVYAADGTLRLVIEDLSTRSLARDRGMAATGDGAPVVIAETFVPLEAPEAALPPEAGRWLLVAEGTATTETLSAALRSRGGEVQCVSLAELARDDAQATMNVLEAACLQDAPPLTGILLAADSSASPGPDRVPSAAEISASVEVSTIALVRLGQVLDRLREQERHPRLVVLTRDARHLDDDGPMQLEGVASSALIGLTRTLANECPEFDVRLLDLDAAAAGDPAILADAVLAEGLESELVLRGAARYAPRLEQKALADIAPQTRRMSLRDELANFAVTMTSPGLIDNVILKEIDLPQPGPDEIVVRVAAVGLNFRDVMAATGILPGELDGEAAWWRNLGLEFAGVVHAVGPGVKTPKVGDRVMGMGKGYLRRYARTPARSVIRVPDGMDLTAAATIPTAFLTAHYALEHVGRLSRGETMLLHLASGGVGLAAIQVAHHAGARILATAGTDRKRDHVRALGVDHVMNSRNLEFTEQVLALTEGRGVDVVLNALSGPGIDKSLECLAPFGRFVEIGKRDLADDKPIGLRALERNNAYAVIDLSTLGHERPDLMFRLMAEVEDRTSRGIYSPLTYKAFPVSQAREALRTFSKAQHIGKVVVTFDEAEVDVELDLARPMALAKDASYLVTGGLRGFGVAIADWLSQRGAGRLVLVGRAGTVDPEAQPLIDAIVARGTEVVAAAVDVTDEAAVGALIEAHARSDKPLRGIVHAAAVIQDGFLSQLSAQSIREVLRPKVAGGWALHAAATRAGAPLDFFVGFSSLAQLIGSPGQANYTAANAVLNALASFRRSRGLPGSAVSWGAIGGSGFVARSEALGSYLDSIGLKTVVDTEAAAALDVLLRAREENLAFAGVDWSAMGRAMPRSRTSPRLKPLLQARSGGRSRFLAELVEAPRDAWEGLLVDLLRAEVAKVLKVDGSAIPIEQKLGELGLDSLSSFELKNRIETQIDISIPVAKFLQTPTIKGLAEVVATTLEARLRAQAAAAASASQVAGTSAQTGGTEYRPLARQVAALAMGGLPMTSPVAKAACEIALSRSCDPEIDFDRLAAGLAQLADVQHALRLVAARDAEGNWTVQVGGPPVLETVSSASDLQGEIFEGSPLWRFGTSLQRGRRAVHLRAHRAAADLLSVRRVMDLLIESAVTGAAKPPQVTLQAFCESRTLPEDSYERGQASSFWAEMLRRAPRPIEIKDRALAMVPVGLGSNRGPVRLLHARIAAPGFGQQPEAEQEAWLLAGYGRALARLYGASEVVVDRQDPARRDAGPADLVGPVADSFPVVLSSLPGTDFMQTVRRVAKGVQLGRQHRAMDTAAIEALLVKDLRDRGIALRQLGFALVAGQPSSEGEGRNPGRDLSAFAHGDNELLLLATADEAGMDVCLALDTSVFGPTEARKIVRRLVAELKAGIEGADLESTAWLGYLDVETASSLSSRPRSGKPVEGAAVSRPAGLAPNELPVSSMQNSLLRSLLIPDATAAYRAYWSPGRAYRVRPRIDATRLERALRTVTAHHEALRTRFSRERDGSVRAFLDTNARAAFGFQDMTAASEAAVMARVVELSRTPIDPFGEPLYQITLLRCPDGSDIIYAKAHLVVSDGWSLALVMEEVFKAYLGMSLEPVEMTTADYVRFIDHTDDPEMAAKRDAYLRELYAVPAPRPPRIGRVARNLPANINMVQAGSYRELHAFGPQAGIQRLQQRARSRGITDTALLIAAVAQTIAARGNVDEVMLTVPVGMRTDQQTKSFIGYLAGSSLVRANVKAYPVLDDLAVALSEQLNRSMEFAPFNYAFRQGPMHEDIVARGSYAALYWTGVLSDDRTSQDAASGSLQRLGNDGEIDFGLHKVSVVPVPHTADSGGAFELDIRTFQGPEGTGYRCAYDEVSFDRADAEALFQEVLERLGYSAGEVRLVSVTGD